MLHKVQTGTDHCWGGLLRGHSCTTGDKRGVLGCCWPLLVQRGPLDQPQWGCNLGAMGTDVGAEVTEECPSAGEWAAD